jgi:hypothetical protein
MSYAMGWFVNDSIVEHEAGFKPILTLKILEKNH